MGNIILRKLLRVLLALLVMGALFLGRCSCAGAATPGDPMDYSPRAVASWVKIITASLTAEIASGTGTGGGAGGPWGVFSDGLAVGVASDVPATLSGSNMIALNTVFGPTSSMSGGHLLCNYLEPNGTYSACFAFLAMTYTADGTIYGGNIVQVSTASDCVRVADAGSVDAIGVMLSCEDATDPTPGGYYGYVVISGAAMVDVAEPVEAGDTLIVGPDGSAVKAGSITTIADYRKILGHVLEGCASGSQALVLLGK